MVKSLDEIDFGDIDVGVGKGITSQNFGGVYYTLETPDAIFPDLQNKLVVWFAHAGMDGNVHASGRMYCKYTDWSGGTWGSWWSLSNSIAQNTLFCVLRIAILSVALTVVIRRLFLTMKKKFNKAKCLEFS